MNIWCRIFGHKRKYLWPTTYVVCEREGCDVVGNFVTGEEFSV